MALRKHMTEEEPLVSLIMPCFNIAPYVKRCVTSLIEQTYTNWELIAVDDGSVDETGAILDKLATEDASRAQEAAKKAKKHPHAMHAGRIRVIHTKNGGAPAARNLAMKEAKGKYIHFIDGDDWVAPKMLQEEVALAEKYDLQLVVSGFTIETYFENLGEGEDLEVFLQEKPHLTEEKIHPYKVYSSAEAFRKEAYQLFDKNLLYTPWNKLFLTSYIKEHNIQFKPTFWDDFPFVLDYIRDISRVGIIPQAFYHFLRLRGDSETARWRKGMYEKREEEHGWMLNLFEHWNLEEDEASQEMIYRRYIERLVGCIENVANPACTLSPFEKKAEIDAMIKTPQVTMALSVAKPRSAYMKMMLVPLRLKSASLALAEGKVISSVKRNNLKTFASLKAHR